MFQRLFARMPILVVVGLSLLVSGCGGSKVTEDNADKITIGMTEKEVSNILGSPTETSEVEMPDMGAMLGGMAGGKMPGMPATPKKAKQATWKDGRKAIVVTFLDGKVVQKAATGF
jgi:SmpA / OmlA family